MVSTMSVRAQMPVRATIASANCTHRFTSLGVSNFYGNAAKFNNASQHASKLALTSRRRCAVAPKALLTVKENATGVEFPLVQKLWLGEEFRAMGAGVRSKKIAFIGVKVYAIALYVEAGKAAHEIGVRDRGGFFENDDDFCQALVDGGFIKALQIELVRDVEGATFVEALNEALTPRMSLTGELSTLDKFREYFEAKKLTKGTNIMLMYRTDATLDVVVKDQRPADWTTLVCDLSIGSPSLCRALFEVFLGEKSVVPDARKEWANGARALLESDKVRRDTRKGGSG